MEKALPAIPAKRYFTIGEVSELCGVKPHVLRYWEQEFTQLRPMKRRGNRRYYQHHEVLMIRRIRDLLYDQGFTISGARNKLQEIVQVERDKRRGRRGHARWRGSHRGRGLDLGTAARRTRVLKRAPRPERARSMQKLQLLRRELFEIRDLLSSRH
jgi:DNA-binding transcriptional MerR regulator